jgi:transposase
LKTPSRLDFTSEEVDALVDRLNNKCLIESDYPLLTDILRAMVWLNFSLQEKELTIKRLRAIFGIKTESAKKLLEFARGNSAKPSNKERSQDKNNTQDSASEGKAKTNESEEGKPRNHGHRPSSDYTEANIINIAHQTLKKGSICPECLKGKLFQLKPGTILHIVGQPWLQVEIYKPERLRCSLCGKIFTADLPRELNTDSRADASAKAIVTLLKYRGGVPFYRQEQVQEILGAPISASEIWQMTEEVADCLHPVYSILCQEAAEADVIHNDDTSAKILSRMKELKEAEEEPDRTGTVTSCIVAVLENINIKIGLFFTGWKHAGENLDELLDGRSCESPPIQQCDALSRNVPKNHNTSLSNCLAHLRRKFYELVDVWPKEVLKIVGNFSSIFKNDHEAPNDPQERLEWHKIKSGPVMDDIKEYCTSLIKAKKVEPNSSLGKAITYLNNHWEAFTLFLRIPGVPLTNNVAEHLIKRNVLNRKNAYFFRNETGAKIADILMSFMETCVLNQVNPYNYFIAIQQYQTDVRKNPKLWLPWLYENRLKEL